MNYTIYWDCIFFLSSTTLVIILAKRACAVFPLYYTAPVPSEKQFNIPLNKHPEYFAGKISFNLLLCPLMRLVDVLQSKIDFGGVCRVPLVLVPALAPRGGGRRWFSDGDEGRGGGEFLSWTSAASFGVWFPAFPRKREAATLCRESLLPLCMALQQESSVSQFGVFL